MAAKLSKTAAVQVSLVGSRRLQRKLVRLGKAAGKAARRGVNKSLQVTVKGIKAAVPPHMKSIRKAIGWRNKKHPRKHFHQAIAGANVGKKGPKRAPHAAIIILGTKQRFHKSGKAVGRVEGDDFVKRGSKRVQSKARKTLIREVQQGIKIEARKK